ncbi:unnamed protein product [Discosporangium mesarthrocarpum]
MRCPSILVAEDNPINRRVVMHMLRALQVHCDYAADGVEAVAACRKQEYDIILMDMMMPNMDGVEATRLIRNSGEVNVNTPVLALTANSTLEARDDCLMAGMTDFTTKVCSLLFSLYLGV